jgi:hypothetical protein
LGSEDVEFLIETKQKHKCAGGKITAVQTCSQRFVPKLPKAHVGAWLLALVAVAEVYFSQPVFGYKVELGFSNPLL